MTQEEEIRYRELMDKRAFTKKSNKGLTKKEYKEYLVLFNKAFSEGVPEIVKAWTDGFKL